LIVSYNETENSMGQLCKPLYVDSTDNEIDCLFHARIPIIRILRELIGAVPVGDETDCGEQSMIL